jgi:hypothetical protein
MTSGDVEFWPPQKEVSTSNVKHLCRKSGSSHGTDIMDE